MEFARQFTQLGDKGRAIHTAEGGRPQRQVNASGGGAVQHQAVEGAPDKSLENGTPAKLNLNPDAFDHNWDNLEGTVKASPGAQQHSPDKTLRKLESRFFNNLTTGGEGNIGLLINQSSGVFDSDPLAIQSKLKKKIRGPK